MLLYSYTGCIFFSYCQNPYSHMKCLFTKIQLNIAIWQYIAIYSNAIRNMALIRIVLSLMVTTGKTACKYGPVFALYLYHIESNRVNTV